MTASQYQRAASEDELLKAVTDALSWNGWRWTHWRRSDKAVMQGNPGVPDIIAVRRGQVRFIELKSEKGKLTQDQWAWLDETDARGAASGMVIRPSTLDAALRELE